ncbi:bifunctional enoyl-CoA hydratase/phosphate acetyltransferase [Eubacteriales bacterium OttesenSCG-928-A19]|nr:bifunctional enoyl-CoA hydratase/phosphate acetyltransferase [Eubacteriales bacterium OttesenSCG-928-A19]
MDFDRIMAALPVGERKRLAVAAAADTYVLEAVCEAKARGLVRPTLFGGADAIRCVASEIDCPLEGMEIHDAPTDEQAAAMAVSLVRDGGADMVMKGRLQTATLLRAVLDKEHGLRKDKVLSHVGVLHSPTLQRMLLLTDGGMVMYPDLETKVALIRNAVTAANGLGIAMPKVAAIAAVEVVNPKMQATVDAALLTMMNRRGQITGCIVDGPLAMDLAITPEAKAHKGVVSDVAGAADILLMHNIDVGNSVLKTFTKAGDCLVGGVLMGALAPVVLTSRSDGVRSKVYSIACAAAIAGHLGDGGAA